MNIPLESEQWLLDGICRKCRRKDYCSKPCKRNEARIGRAVADHINERTRIGEMILAIDEGRPQVWKE